jgi:hypothetical protein
MFSQKFLILVFLLAFAAAVPTFGAACTNPCTGSLGTGADTTDRTSFGTDNSDLSFSNIIFDNATGTYTAAGGLNGTTAPSASLFGVSFIGCFSNDGPCASNSPGVGVGNVANWDGGSDPALLFNSTPNHSTFETFTITLPANTYAFAVDLLNTSTTIQTPFQLNVDAAGGSTAVSVSLPGSVFFGFRSATPINSVSLYAGYSNEQMAIDNFEIGELAPMAPVAEAKTLLLVGSGLLLLLYVRRRRGASLRVA